MNNTYQLSIEVLIKETLEQCRGNGETQEDIINKILNNDLVGFCLGNGHVTKEWVHEYIREELIVEYNSDTVVLTDAMINPWFDDFRKQSKILPRWDAYAKYLKIRKGWKGEVVHRLDKETNEIMDQLFNPREAGGYPYDIRGMVVGDVQSGKTSNYIGVCSKALDAGYKLIIILAGLHKNLRSQTQARIEEELLGYRQHSNSTCDNNPIGVGKWRNKRDAILDKTYTTTEKDINEFVKKQSPKLTPEDRLVLVVKKNKSVLQSLIDYMKKQNLPKDYPVLIIDDECDQASVNTKKMQQYFQSNEKETEDRKTRKEQLEINPTTINKKIRELLHLFNQKVYLGYTATPYANIFIDPEAPQDDYIGKDLFPKDFIISLTSSSDYTGVKTFFREEGDGPNYKRYLFKPVLDERDLIERPKKQQPIIKKLNGSLENAIYDFLIATAIRRQRGSEDHNSMLIHISRFTENQEALFDLVNNCVNSLCSKLRYGEEDIIEKFKDHWEKNFEECSKRLLGDKFEDDWIKISEELLGMAQSVEIKVNKINGHSKDALDYINSKNKVFIAIGGDKLSRGLTLEGLTVSYYLRGSNTYDTLMQMGRWFGYRKKYIDVCRIYTTEQLMDSFEAVSMAEEELRDLITYMGSIGAKPKDFSLRVQKHPSLKPTSQNKMRGIKNMKYSLAGVRQQISSIAISRFRENYESTEEFIDSLKTYRSMERRGGVYVFEHIPSTHILDFLRKFSVGGDSVKSKNVDTGIWAKYIEEMNAKGELTDWTVGLYSNIKGKGSYRFLDYDLELPKRRVDVNGDVLTMRVVATQGAEFIDFKEDDKDFKRYKDRKIKDIELRGKRSVRKGVLNIYVINPKDREDNELEFDFNPISLEVSFPDSENATEVTDYYINLVEEGDYAE